MYTREQHAGPVQRNQLIKVVGHAGWESMGTRNARAPPSDTAQNPLLNVLRVLASIDAWLEG
eukprot:scaffold104019_cov21-Tisochrysis_lutea.AAC.2